MIFRVFAAALAAGVLAAILITGLQHFITAPMIFEAETYETADVNHDNAAPPAEEQAWTPAPGMERLLYTLLANLVAAIGFSLLVIVGMTFDPPLASAGRGVLWGMAGFAVFTLAPNLGLAPELPGMLAAALKERQIWWLAAVVFSAGGLGSMIFGKSLIVKALGPVLLVLPHLWGAPHIAAESRVPAELAARFSASTIVLSAVFWVVIGYFSGLIFSRLGERRQDA